MCRILPAIDSLDQHLYHLKHHPEAFRPPHCPHCGRCGVWRHGYYRRKADRFNCYSLHLRSHFPALGRADSQTAFWWACLRRMSLAAAMAVLDHNGVTIP